MQTRGNKAKRDKDSILADVKNLLKILHPALQNMNKIERSEGAPHEMKMACYNMIRYFTIAKASPEVRKDYIDKMTGEYGALLAAFELSISFGLLTDSLQLRIAEQLERIQEGVDKWRNASRSPKSQAQRAVTESPQSSLPV